MSQSLLDQGKSRGGRSRTHWGRWDVSIPSGSGQVSGDGATRRRSSAGSQSLLDQGKSRGQRASTCRCCARLNPFWIRASLGAEEGPNLDCMGEVSIPSGSGQVSGRRTGSIWLTWCVSIPSGSGQVSGLCSRWNAPAAIRLNPFWIRASLGVRSAIASSAGRSQSLLDQGKSRGRPTSPSAPTTRVSIPSGSGQVSGRG